MQDIRRQGKMKHITINVKARMGSRRKVIERRDGAWSEWIAKFGGDAQSKGYQHDQELGASAPKCNEARRRTRKHIIEGLERWRTQYLLRAPSIVKRFVPESRHTAITELISRNEDLVWCPLSIIDISTSSKL